MSERKRQLTRRGFLGGSALVGAGAAAGAAGGVIVTRATYDESPTPAASVPFHGAHQAGIDTAAQDRLAFAAFDLTSTQRSDLQDLLREWTQAAVAMCAGPAGAGRLGPAGRTTGGYR